jgi:hypothetical protein
MPIRALIQNLKALRKREKKEEHEKKEKRGKERMKGKKRRATSNSPSARMIDALRSLNASASFALWVKD